MRLRSTAALASLACAAATGTAPAHHSFAMFDNQHPIEISGAVKEFRFVNPHSVLIVEVKSADGVVKDWTLEGPAPGIRLRQGVTAKTFRPGDAFRGARSPLQSARAGWSYSPAEEDLRNAGACRHSP